MALSLDPKLLEMMEMCCLDRYQRMKLLPILVPSQTKFYKPEDEFMSEKEINEYMSLVNVEIDTSFWPATTEQLEVRVVKTPGFNFLCDDLIKDEKALYKLMVNIYNHGNCDLEHLGLILLIIESILHQNKESIVPILHNLSMFITNEIIGNEEMDPLRKLIVSENIESTDPYYNEDIDFSFQHLIKSEEKEAKVNWISDYLRSMYIFIDKPINKEMDEMIQKTFQVPSKFEQVSRYITSTAMYRDVLRMINCIEYKDVIKIVYFTYILCLRIPEVSGQILYELARYLYHESEI